MPIGKPVIHAKSNLSSSAQEGSKKNDLDFELIEPRYDMLDIIVNKKTLQEIRSVISLKRDFDKVFIEMGFGETHKYSKKFIVNFYGEPGTGKTITAHAIAKEFNKKLLLVDYSEIESKYVGDTPKNLKKVFDFARNEECVVFFDEADAILSKRVTNMLSATDTSVNQTRSVLLNILNDFDGDIIFATNFISNYDPAFMRRISKHVFFELPDLEARIRLFEKYIPRRIIGNLDVYSLATEFDSLSAADIEKAVLMAAFHASSSGKVTVCQEDICYQIGVLQKNRLDNLGEQVVVKNRIVSKGFVEKQLGVNLS